MKSFLLRVVVLLVVFGGVLSANLALIVVDNHLYKSRKNSSRIVVPNYKYRGSMITSNHLYNKNSTDRKKRIYKYTNTAFNKYNYRYKIVSLDTRNWTNNKKDILAKRRIITKFGNALGKKAVIQNWIMKTSKKRAYLNRIQRELGTHYSYSNAPFLIFFKKAKRGGYKPYKIISLSSMSAPYLRQKLSMLGRAISSGASKRKVYASLEKVRKKVYARNQKKVSRKAKSAMDKIISTLKSWFI